MKFLPVSDANFLLKQKQAALFCLLYPYFAHSFNQSVLRSVPLKYRLQAILVVSSQVLTCFRFNLMLKSN